MYQATAEPSFTEFLSVYGPYWALAIYVLLKEILPFIRDKLYPDIVEERKEREKKELASLDRQLHIQEKHIDALQSIMLSQEALTVQIENISETLKAQTEAIAVIKEDLAALYGKLDQPRPSRYRKSEGRPE